jgi:hypothetical protein
MSLLDVPLQPEEDVELSGLYRVFFLFVESMKPARRRMRF